MAKVIVIAFPGFTGVSEPHFNSSGLVETDWQGRTDLNSTAGFGGTFAFAWGTSSKRIVEGIKKQAVSQFAIAFSPNTITTGDVQVFGVVED